METTLSDIMSNNGQMISLLIDIAVIAGLFALWLVWYRNGNRQKKLEQLLAETARQLDEATQHLNQATLMIDQLKRQEEKPRSAEPAAYREPVQKPVRNSPARAQEPPVKLPPENSTQATMVLRMHREGEEPEAIADRLDIPLAQVKLLLKLYASKSAA